MPPKEETLVSKSILSIVRKFRSGEQYIAAQVGTLLAASAFGKGRKMPGGSLTFIGTLCRVHECRLAKSLIMCCESSLRA